MYWVLCEAIGAAETLRESTGDTSYDLDVDAFASWARTYLIERPGEWREELDSKNRPASGTWSGKPDIYHALQAIRRFISSELRQTTLQQGSDNDRC